MAVVDGGDQRNPYAERDAQRSDNQENLSTLSERCTGQDCRRWPGSKENSSKDDSTCDLKHVRAYQLVSLSEQAILRLPLSDRR